MKTLEQVRKEKLVLLKQLNELEQKRQELTVVVIELQGQEKLLSDDNSKTTKELEL